MGHAEVHPAGRVELAARPREGIRMGVPADAVAIAARPAGEQRDDAIKARRRRGARPASQRIPADSGKAVDEVVWSGLRVAAQRAVKPRVDGGVAVVARAEVARVRVGRDRVARDRVARDRGGAQGVHEFGGPGYAGESRVERTGHRLRGDDADGLVQAVSGGGGRVPSGRRGGGVANGQAGRAGCERGPARVRPGLAACLAVCLAACLAAGGLLAQ